MMRGTSWLAVLDTPTTRVRGLSKNRTNRSLNTLCNDWWVDGSRQQCDNHKATAVLPMLWLYFSLVLVDLIQDHHLLKGKSISAYLRSPDNNIRLILMNYDLTLFMEMEIRVNWCHLAGINNHAMPMVNTVWWMPNGAWCMFYLL
jgi:hypothetical protein